MKDARKRTTRMKNRREQAETTQTLQSAGIAQEKGAEKEAAPAALRHRGREKPEQGTDEKEDCDLPKHTIDYPAEQILIRQDSLKWENGEMK